MMIVVRAQNKEQQIWDLDKLNSKVLKELAHILETVSLLNQSK